MMPAGLGIFSRFRLFHSHEYSVWRQTAGCGLVFLLMSAQTGLSIAGGCEGLKQGVRKFTDSSGLVLISVAKAELLSLDDDESFEFAEDEARLDATQKLSKHLPETWFDLDGSLIGLEELESCQSGRYVITGVKISERSVYRAKRVAALIERSLKEEQKPTLAAEP